MGFFDNYNKDKNAAAVEAAVQDTEAPETAEATKEEEKVVALKKFHHGITKDAVMAMFDQYIREGGSQLNFYTEVYMQIFQVSGFFSVSLTNQMQDALEDAKEVL